MKTSVTFVPITIRDRWFAVAGSALGASLVVTVLVLLGSSFEGSLPSAGVKPLPLDYYLSSHSFSEVEIAKSTLKALQGDPSGTLLPAGTIDCLEAREKLLGVAGDLLGNDLPMPHG